jgi:hypothetical protein
LPDRLALRQRLDPDRRDAGIIRLDFPRPSWDLLQEDAQAMWDTWVYGGELRYGETATAVRLRKRGDNSIHWLMEKRSLTVRTRREEFYKGYRTFGLSIRDVLPAYLANRLAWEFGLLAPRAEVVPVYLNNSYYGIFRFIEPVDEGFLDRATRMPGNLWRGDRAERGDYFKSVPRSLFENPYLWERTDTVQRQAPPAAPLPPLLRDLHAGGVTAHENLLRRVDRDEFARLFAYLLLIGDPFHMDDVHNQFIYEDPVTQLLHPVVWDSRLLDAEAALRYPLNTWYQRLLRDPFIVDRTARQLALRLRDGTFLRTADSLAQRVESRYAEEFTYDRLRGGMVAPVGSAAEAMATLQGNAALLARRLDSSVVAVFARPGPVTVIDLETRGFAGANLDAIELRGAAPGPITLRLDHNQNGVLDTGDPAIPLRADAANPALLQLTAPEPLYASWDAGARGVRAGRYAYRLFVLGAPGTELALRCSNRVTGAPAQLVPWEAGATIAPPTGVHPWSLTLPAGRQHRWSGTLRLAETVRIGPRDSLSIAPGTTIWLEPGVSVVAHGRVVAAGTPGRPVRLLARDTLRPWGVLALQGQGADSSVLEHVELAFGSRAVVDEVEYRGTLSVHRADRVRLEHLRIRDSRSAPAALRAVQARDLDIMDALIQRAEGAGVLLELATGTIRGSLIEASGRHGLVLRAANPSVRENTIRGAVGRGLLIAEGSNPEVAGNLLERNVLGIEVTDGASPVFLHNTVANNRTGMVQTASNPRYDLGGWSTILQTLFRGNRAARGQDSASRLTTLGAVGLDSTAPAAGEGEAPDWLYAWFGLVTPDRSAGRPAALAWRQPESFILRGAFEDNFESVADGWEAEGGTRRLEKRGGALVLETEGTAGAARLPLDLRLENPAVLVLEVAGQDIQRARVTVTGTRTATADFVPSGDLDRFGFVTLTLQPGHYRDLRIEIQPITGIVRLDPVTGLSELQVARLDLRSYAIHPAHGLSARVAGLDPATGLAERSLP